MIGAVLAALMCLTTWVAASVSLWIAPAYLALMVLIFVAPRNRRQKLALSQASANAGSDDKPDWTRKRSAPGTGETDPGRTAAEPVGAALAGELTVHSTHSNADQAEGSTLKSGRGRSRTRRPAKSAAQAASVPPPVTWIRVGPGKFVRADSATGAIAQASPQTQPGLCVAGADSAADLSAAVPPALMDAAESAVEHSSCDPPHSTQSDPSQGAMPENLSESVTEEHGIAPSALGPVSSTPVPLDRADDEVSCRPTDPPSNPVPVASQIEKAPAGHRGFKRRWQLFAWSRSEPRRVLRRSTGPTPVAHRATRRGVATRRRLQTWMWLRDWSNRSPQPHCSRSARRVFRRVVRLGRALRPRSPPDAYSKNQHGVAVAEKSITATNGFRVRSSNQLEAGECADQNE
jgi:hypothetical protein